MRPTVRGLLVMEGFAVALLSACGGDDADGVADRGVPAAKIGSLSIHAPYVPAPPSDIAALYFVVANEGDQVDRLITISADAAGMVIHRGCRRWRVASRFRPEVKLSWRRVAIT
jgi:hypothetical protein